MRKRGYKLADISDGGNKHPYVLFIIILYVFRYPNPRIIYILDFCVDQ